MVKYKNDVTKAHLILKWIDVSFDFTTPGNVEHTKIEDLYLHYTQFANLTREVHSSRRSFVRLLK